MSNLEYCAKQLKKIQNRIESAASKVGRDASEISLVGAAKMQSAKLVDDFHTAGLAHVGENYLQEALQRQKQLAHSKLTWHFIGKIQSNKTQAIAQHFNWVHGVDRLKVAKRLADQNPNKANINVLLQLNLDHEDSKGGVSQEDAPKLCDQVSELCGITLRGFMLIPKARDIHSEQRAVFAQAHQLMHKTNQAYGLKLDTLSMGMSGDLESAIAEGSTIVRIGTDLFGPRSV